MKQFTKIVRVVLMTLLLMFAFSYPGMADADKEMQVSKVCFKHKHKDGVFKTNCIKMMGGDDAYQVYRCFDAKEDRRVKFDPGDEYEIIPECKVCIRHRGSWHVLYDCIIGMDEDGISPVYKCFHEERCERLKFAPIDEYEVLKRTNSQCAAVSPKKDCVPHDFNGARAKDVPRNDDENPMNGKKSRKDKEHDNGKRRKK